MEDYSYDLVVITECLSCTNLGGPQPLQRPGCSADLQRLVPPAMAAMVAGSAWRAGNHQPWEPTEKQSVWRNRANDRLSTRASHLLQEDQQFPGHGCCHPWRSKTIRSIACWYHGASACGQLLFTSRPSESRTQPNQPTAYPQRKSAKP